MKYNVLPILLLALVMVMTGCEDSDVTAPDGSGVTLTPTPGAVAIDQTLNETEGTIALVAQVVDAGGLPLADIPLFFTSTGGLLGSVSNRCRGGICSRSVDSCTTDVDCPFVIPDALETDNSGIVSDTLTLRLFQDPDEVEVTVKGTNLEARELVGMIVNTGPDDAQPFIMANPGTGQRTGLPFTLNGSGSTFDPQVQIECFNWELFSSLPVFDANSVGCVECPVPGSILCSEVCESRSASNAILALSIGEVGDPLLDQDIAVILNVSDDPSIVCENGMPVDREKFSEAGAATLNYLIRCDITAPFVEAGSDKSGSLSANGGTVNFSLTATGSDLEDTILDFVWDCGNGQGGTGQTIVCSYTSEGDFSAVVTVSNDCGLFSQDSLVVDIDP